MQGREKHTFPRFISLPMTIFLWALLALFIAAGVLVWGEQVPTYTTTQGIVVVQPTTQPSGKVVPTTGKQVPAMETVVPTTGKQVLAMGTVVPAIGRLAPETGKPIPPTAMGIFFFPPARVNIVHVGMPIRLHVGPSGVQLSSQIASIEPHAMSPIALRSRFHLENYPLLIAQPAAVVIVKLNSAFAAAYAGSMLTADIQVGSQSLISLLPGVGNLFKGGRAR
jgi:hypothetical protein